LWDREYIDIWGLWSRNLKFAVLAATQDVLLFRGIIERYAGMKELPVVLNALQGSLIFFTTPVFLVSKESVLSQCVVAVMPGLWNGRPYRWALMIPERYMFPFLVR
jgi:hypothetical protein